MDHERGLASSDGPMTRLRPLPLTQSTVGTALLDERISKNVISEEADEHLEED